MITQWKPELALASDPTLINLTVPDAIPTVKSIWSGGYKTVSRRMDVEMLIATSHFRIHFYPAYKSVQINSVRSCYVDKIYTHRTSLHWR